MAGGRQVFSAEMRLKDYGDTLGQLRGHSPDLACGNDRGSFLATYLCHHLRHSDDPMAKLQQDQAEIKALMKPESGGAKIIFNTMHQLPDFFILLTNHLPLYYALIEHQFLSVDAVCSNGDTFLNIYFRYILITEEKLKEAKELLRFSQLSLSIANQRGEFPLSLFFIKLVKEGKEILKKIAVSQDSLNDYLELVDGFAIQQSLDMASDDFMNFFMNFYQDNKNERSMLAFMNRVLVKAANYGVSIHRPLRSLNERSLLGDILENDQQMRWSPMELRQYYMALNPESVMTKVVHYSDYKCLKSYVYVDSNNQMLGVVQCQLRGVVSELEEKPYRLCPDAQEGMLLLDSQAAAKWFPKSYIDFWYGHKFSPTSGDLPLIPNYDHLIKPANDNGALPSLISEVKPVSLHSLPHSDVLELDARRVSTRYDGFYFGTTKAGEAVFSAAGLLDASQKFVLPMSGVPYSTASDRETYLEMYALREQYVAAMQKSLKKSKYYHPLSEYYYRVHLTIKNADKVNVLAYYLRTRGFGHGEDPRYFYNMDRSFKLVASVPKALLDSSPTPLQTVFEAEGNSWRYFPEAREPFSEKQNIDIAILYHLKKQGCGFYDKEVTDFIASIILDGRLEDPALYRLMFCLRDCGAVFPQTILGQTFRDYVAKRLAEISVQTRREATHEHLRLALALFQQESPEDVSKIRDYVASFGLALPHDLVTVQSVSGYLLSDEGVRQFNIKMDEMFQEINSPRQGKHDTRDALAALAIAINQGQPCGKLMSQALDLYYTSEDYKQRFKDEQAYYVFFRTLMIETCNMAQAALASVMTREQGGGFFKAMNRSRTSGDIAKRYIEDLQAIVMMLADTHEAREAHVERYFILIKKAGEESIDKTQNKGDPKSVVKAPIPSATIRNIVRKFAKAEYFEQEQRPSDGIINLLNPLLLPELQIAIAPLEYQAPKPNKLPQTDSSVDESNTPGDNLSPTAKPSAPPLENEMVSDSYQEYRDNINALYANDPALTEALDYLNTNMSRLPEDDAFTQQIKKMCCPLTGLLAKYTCVIDGGLFKYFDLNEVVKQGYDQSRIQLRPDSEFHLMLFIVKQAYEVLKLKLTLSDLPETPLYPEPEVPKNRP